MNAALDRIDRVDGSGVNLGSHEPTYPDFARSEHQRRYARLTTLMEDEGLDVVVYTQEESIRYLTGYNSVIWAVGRWLPCVLLATRDPAQAVLLPSAFDLGAVAGSAWVATVDGHADATELPAKVRAHLKRLGAQAGRVGMELGPGSFVALPWDTATAVHAAAGDGVRDASQLLSVVRMLKSEAELERIRRVVGCTVAGYRAALESARVGMTERELVSIAASTMFQQGATAGTRPVFLNCVSGSDRYALVDSPASGRTFRDGDLVFLDGGGGSDGYMSDIIRLIAIGDVSPEVEGWSSLAQEALEATLAAVRPGIAASELFDVGYQYDAAAGLAGSAGGLSGHGVGMDLWERPFIRQHTDPNEDISLRSGMTLSLEPILMPTGPDGALAGIFVYEQQVLVTDAGHELLSAGLEATLWHAQA